MPKHLKSSTPSDKDLKENPLIGGSKGARASGVSADELEASEGANTVEGDIGNDTTPQGGIRKADALSGKGSRPLRQGRR